LILTVKVETRHPVEGQFGSEFPAKCFARMIPHLKHLSYVERLVRLKLWSLDDRRIRAKRIRTAQNTHCL